MWECEAEEDVAFYFRQFQQQRWSTLNIKRQPKHYESFKKLFFKWPEQYSAVDHRWITQKWTSSDVSQVK